MGSLGVVDVMRRLQRVGFRVTGLQQLRASPRTASGGSRWIAAAQDVLRRIKQTREMVLIDYCALEGHLRFP